MLIQNERRTNTERSETTRAALVAAARKLFIDQGFAATSTPEIVKLAGLTRGALYHHFAEKRALLRAVIEQEAVGVAQEIDEATLARKSQQSVGPALEQLQLGSETYFDAMEKPGRARLLLVEGPAFLGNLEMSEIDRSIGSSQLASALQAVRPDRSPEEVNVLGELLSAAFERAALAIDSGVDPKPYRRMMAEVIEKMVT